MLAVPACNSLKAVAEGTETFKKQNEPVVSSPPRGQAADGCFCLTSPDYTSAGGLPWGHSASWCPENISFPKSILRGMNCDEFR